MPEPSNPAPDDYRQTIIAARPDLAGLPFALLNDGWDSLAFDIGGEWIFKFPRSAAAAERLRREASLLQLVRAHVDLPVPELMLHEAPTLFSQHRKIAGTSLLAEHYPALSERQRDALAESMALLHAQLHAIPHDAARAAGAQPIESWPAPAEILAKAAPVLPAHLRPYLERTIAAYAALDPDDEIYGYFDGHGWNMAFDHGAGRLNGVFDFADSGFGARHQDLSYTGFISPDLTSRITRRYELFAGRATDLDRVLLLHGTLRLVEVGQEAERPEDTARALAAVEAWSQVG